ncbi:hypothetical protein H310_01536 [Aphanomyces invadans]|uniref:N-acetyltransferase domain-containing protein n=1 Tax=Aphanomyces invadans TaxID=157072 RepID=A0A024URJ9_9STRA|nr:hypothetical protein H310_01536 [Aphanomyces invadans]ETW09076.1 hypothetical protein H310_01536 [Aphanomyces invadans]|eukprot:XP_008862881.1 hypothetical protein H310_01536 [Aphanomyces invadans]
MVRTRSTFQSVADPSVFLDVTLSLRKLDRIGTNKIASIAIGVVMGAHPPDNHRYFVATASDGSDRTGQDVRVTSFALYSCSSGLLLSPNMSTDEATALGKLVATTIDTVLEEVRGAHAATLAFNGSYCRHRLTPTSAVLKHELLLYSLRDLRPPSSSNVAGNMRVASGNTDAMLLTGWASEFFAYMGSSAHEAPTFVASRLKRHSMFIWEVDGKPVGFASYAPAVEVDGETVYRIGSVFITPTERCKGYASALTAALSQHLRESNSSQTARICLFADAANPASNKAYQRIGFEIEGPYLLYTFTTAPGSV